MGRSGGVSGMSVGCRARFVAWGGTIGDHKLTGRAFADVPWLDHINLLQYWVEKEERLKERRLQDGCFICDIFVR